MKPYLIEEEVDYLRFTINRPELRNAINFEIMEGLEKFLERGENKQYKALVITGAGNNAFCSGGDLSIFHQLKTEKQAFEMLSKMAKILYKLLTFPKPTVALLNGVAVGGGCELATACDFRIAHKDSKAGFIQGKLAITTGWGGGAMCMEKLIPANALKLLMTANVFSASQLLEMGFINEIYEGNGDPACQVFLQPMLELEADVLSAYKKIWVRKWEETNLESRIIEEVRHCAKLWEAEAHHKQVARFLMKE